MMTVEERLKMYREKKNFIYDVSKAFAFTTKGHTVEGIRYEVLFKENELGQHFSEWLTIRYFGGAEAHCCISDNSNSANFRAIAKMIEGGYYDENEHYLTLRSKDWKILDLAKMCVLQEMK
jgi:hypothetical protein